MNKPLKTYLKTYRRRSCLTQDEVAFLLGGMCGTMVARHELGHRTPVLENLLAYCIIFGVQPDELYRGVHWKVQAVVQRRAKGLLRSLERQAQSPRRDQKVAHVLKLVDELAP